MKKGYIIATASGWYWRAYNTEMDEFRDVGYTVFDKIEFAQSFLEIALNCRNVGTPAVEIKTIYYKI